MRKQAGDSSKLLASAKDLKNFLQEGQDDVRIVGFFKTEEEGMYKTYLNAGEMGEKFFGAVHLYLCLMLLIGGLTGIKLLSGNCLGAPGAPFQVYCVTLLSI